MNYVDDPVLFIFLALCTEGKVIARVNDTMNYEALHDMLEDYNVGDMYYEFNPRDPNMEDFIQDIIPPISTLNQKLRQDSHISITDFETIKRHCDNSRREIEYIPDFYLVISQTEGIRKYLEGYLSAFMQNQLKSKGVSVLGYERQYDFALEKLAALEADYGRNFVVRRADIFQQWYMSPDSLKKDQAYRLLDILGWFQIQNYVKLSNFDYEYEDKYQNSLYNYSIHVELLKTTQEIKDIQKNWAHYGSLRILKGTEQVYYKNNSKNYRSKDSKTFRLLEYLIQKPATRVPVSELQKAKALEQKNHLKAQEELKGLAKDIKRDLDITQDADRGIDIVTPKGYVMLVSLPQD